MPTIRGTVEISASPERVWNIIANPANLPRLAPYVLSSEFDPPGLMTKGAKGHAIGMMAGRKVDVYAEVAEAEPNKKLSLKQRPGGVLKFLSTTITLEPTEKGTLAKEEFQFEVSMGALGKALSALVIERSIRKNAGEYLQNLKKIAENQETPSKA
jgi:carbon monoxide dehydrogenase subunit G